jgi:hypothetical protein
LGAARKAAQETAETLASTGNGHQNHELFADLYKQVKELFSDDETQRQAAWYIDAEHGSSNECKKKYYKLCATYFFERFKNERDRRWSSGYLITSGLILVAITFLSKVFPEGGVWAEPVWWVLFGILLLALSIPTAYVLMGRRLKIVSEIITADIREKKNMLASDAVISAVRESASESGSAGKA